MRHSGCGFTQTLSSKLYLPAATLHAMCNVLAPVKEEYEVEICTGVSDSFFSLEIKLLSFFPRFTGFIN